MTNIEILELATVISNDLSDPRRDLVVTVLNDYYKRSSTIDDLRSAIESANYHEFIEELNGKSIYRSIVNLYEGELSSHRAAILASSLLTHASIQMELDGSITPSKVRYKDLLQVLLEYTVIGRIDQRELRQIITSLGFIYKSN